MPRIRDDEHAAVVIDLTIFKPCVRRDKHDNEVSEIMFPDYTYAMVHHPSKSWKTESATIYEGRNSFIKFSSYETDSDTVPHEVRIHTAIGTFSTSWGDGDNLGYYYPEVIDTDEHFAKMVKQVSDRIRSGKYEDDEQAFTLLTMSLINLLQFSDNPLLSHLWLDKPAWETMKKRFEEERTANRLAYYARVK